MAIQAAAPSLSDIWLAELRIREVRALANFILRVTFLDGATYDIDFSRVVGTGGTTDALTNPAVFAEAGIGEGGFSVHWPGGFDNGSDTLRWDGELARLGLTRQDCASE